MTDAELLDQDELIDTSMSNNAFPKLGTGSSATYISPGTGGAGHTINITGAGGGGGSSYAGGTVTVGTATTSTVYGGTGTTGVSYAGAPGSVFTVGGSGPMWTTGTTGGYYGPTGPTGYYYGNAPQTTSIEVGGQFKISGPTQGNDGPVTIECKNRKVDVSDVISMVHVFKALLRTVAEDNEFCVKHPEIADMAQAFLMEELKK